MAQPQIKWTHVESSNVESVAYHNKSHSICVKFHNGGLYTYDGVDHDVYVDLVNAESVGQYLNRAIKGVYAYDRWYSEQEMLNELETRKK